MKRLVVDGNSVYEIDEDCVRRRHPPKDCELYQYLTNNTTEDNKLQLNTVAKESIQCYTIEKSERSGIAVGTKGEIN